MTSNWWKDGSTLFFQIKILRISFRTSHSLKKIIKHLKYLFNATRTKIDKVLTEIIVENYPTVMKHLSTITNNLTPHSATNPFVFFINSEKNIKQSLFLNTAHCLAIHKRTFAALQGTVLQQPKNWWAALKEGER